MKATLQASLRVSHAKVSNIFK